MKATDKGGREEIRRFIALPPGFPKIVTLCGSTRFKQEFIQANFRETMAGHIVLSVGLYSHADADVYSPSQEEKEALDELHKRKIDLCDEVLVLNVKCPRCSDCKEWFKPTDDPRVAGGGFRSCNCFGAAEFIPYIGNSTRSEIAYATQLGKVIRYLEEPR